MGEFRIRSNDADTPDYRIELCAHTPGEVPQYQCPDTGGE